MKSKNIFIVLFFIVCALPLRLDAIWVNNDDAYKVLQKFQYIDQLEILVTIEVWDDFAICFWLGTVAWKLLYIR